MQRAPLSIIIPASNASDFLGKCLESLVPGAASELVREVIVADSGSTDDSVLIAEGAGCRIVRSGSGRGLQFREGAKAAAGEWFLFLHVDCVLESGWETIVARHIESQPSTGGKAAYLRLAFDEKDPRLSMLAASAALRCAILGLPYGDQGLLISRLQYEELGGHQPWPIYEDVDIVRRIKRQSKTRLAGLAAKSIISAKRYQQVGYLRPIMKNQYLILRYFLGLTPYKSR